MVLLTGELPATRSYTKRRWCWFQPHDADADGTRSGTLTVILQTTKRRAGKSGVVASYGVIEVTREDPTLPRDVRVFLLAKAVRADEEPVFHRVVLGSDDAGLVVEECTCKAFQCDAPCCRHLDCLRLLVEEGVL